MPSGHPPHKQDHPVTEGEKRWDMVRLAIAGNPHFAYSDFELQRPGYTYTAQTLALLQEAYPEHTFYFIIGADSLYQIEGWYHPEQVMARATLPVSYTHLNAFIIVYFIILGVSVLLVSLDNFDFGTSFSAVVATLNNIGPGISEVGPAANFSGLSAMSKWVLIFDMLAGRLELFPMLVLLSPGTWIKR